MTIKIDRLIELDDPVDLGAGWSKVDRTDRRYIDNQILALEQHMLRSSLRGVAGTWMTLDPGASRDGAAGDCVCLSLSGNLATNVTLATASTLAASGGVLGVLTAAYAKGSMAHLAVFGALPPSVTGLDTTPGDAQFVRVNPTTSRCERVASIGGGDYQVGRVDANGQMFMQRTVTTGGGGGGGGSVDGPIASTVNAFALWSVSDGTGIKDSVYTGTASGVPVAATDVVRKNYADALLLNADNTVAKNGALSPYAVAATDAFVDIDTSASATPMQINLPAPSLKRVFVVTDVGNLADTRPITLHRLTAYNINRNAADLVLNAPGGSWLVRSNGTEYIVRGSL